VRVAEPRFYPCAANSPPPGRASAVHAGIAHNARMQAGTLTTEPNRGAAHPRWRAWTWLPVLLAAFAGQWLLVANPGYFSHDELQWGAFARQVPPVPWVSWTDVGTFQYRPLTFNLWLSLSRLLFAQPVAFHAAMVAWGACNAALACALGRRFGMTAATAAVGALAFALGPFAAYTDGWVGTIGDLAWVSCALLAGLACLRWPRPLPAAIAAAAFTALAFFAKEAAISIPALLALAWWFDRRRRHWLAATLAASAVALSYLALRAGALLHGAPEGSQYVVHASHVPMRWLEYQLFPFMPSEFEAFSTLAFGIHRPQFVAGVLWLALVAALWRSGSRFALVFLAGGFAALGPVLLLGMSANQYGYGFAAIGAMAAAAAWPRAPAWGRAVLLACALAIAWHGIATMRSMRHVGEVQAVFSPALAAALRDHPGAHLRLRPVVAGESWIYSRLTFNIPSYDGVPMGDRVELITGDAQADFLIAPDGTLRRVP